MPLLEIVLFDLLDGRRGRVDELSTRLVGVGRLEEGPPTFDTGRPAGTGFVFLAIERALGVGLPTPTRRVGLAMGQSVTTVGDGRMRRCSLPSSISHCGSD